MSETTAEVMPEGNGENIVGQGESQPPIANEGNSGNPAWQPFLDVLPSSLYPTVTPILQEWDRGVQSRFQEIHQQYEPYKAYQDLIDNEVEPEAIQYALGIFEQLNDNPRAIYDALVQTFGEEWGLNQQQPDPSLNPSYESYDDNPVDPRIAQLEEGFKQLASTILGERQQQEEQQIQAQMDYDLDQELTSLKETYGDFNERAVLGLMLSGMSGEEAVAEYMSDRNSAIEQTRRPPAPAILSQGGVQSVTQDVRKLDSKDTRALVAQMLQQNAGQNP